MIVTIALNTWNRSSLLDATLARFRALEVPVDVRLEILVVDNNSTDATADIVRKHSAHLPIDYLFEPRQGTSFAKNTGLERARGELILWTDDDVLVDPGWLKAYLHAASEFPDATIFGGVIEPWFPDNPPRWVVDNLDILKTVWAMIDLGPETRELAHPSVESVYGANMAFRTTALQRYRFNPALGDIGDRIRKGEEIELIERMREDGNRAVWVGSARVKHYIIPHRLSTDYVWNLLEQSSNANYNPNEFAKVARIGGVPRYLIRQYLLARIKSMILSPFRSRAWATSYSCAASTRGLIRAARRAATHAETQPTIPTEGK